MIIGGRTFHIPLPSRSDGNPISDDVDRAYHAKYDRYDGRIDDSVARRLQTGLDVEDRG